MDTVMNYSILFSALLTTPDTANPSPVADLLRPHLQQLGQLLDSFGAQPVTPAATRDFETTLQARLRQLGLDLCDWLFNHLEPDDREQLPLRLDYDGERFRCRQRSPNQLATLFGTFTLRRYLYEDLEPGNPCLFPLEKQLGVVAGAATPALAERAAWWLAQSPQGGTLRTLARDHDVKWSADTLRQVTAAVAAGLEQQRPAAQAEKLLSWLSQAEQSRGRYRPSLVAGRDGIHLPMRQGVYREGATATLSVYNRRGQRLGTVYLGRMPEAGQGTLSEQLTALLVEVLRRWPGPVPRLAYVTDNGSHPVAYYRTVLSRLCHPRTGERLLWQRISDYYHAASYVQQLAAALFGESKQGRQWSRRMRRRLKEKDGLKRVLQSATMHASQRGLSGRRGQDFRKAYRYLRRHGPWLRYWQYQRMGLPLGSGVTEAACKTVFTQRLKQSGMRWEVSSGQVVVTLRVLLLSGVWETAVTKWLDSQQFPTRGVQHLSEREVLEKAA
jgi:hypothetical protein